jgi:hypothetical protein
MVAKRVAAETAVAGFADIQGAIVAPQIVPPERYSTEYASNPTAVANPWSVIDYPWASSDNANSAPLASSELFMAMFRDPLRNLVYYDQNNPGSPGTPGTSTYKALMTPFNGTSVVPVSPVNLPGTFSTGSIFDEDVHVAMWQATGSYTPHGPFLYCGSDERTDRTYRWFDLGETLTVDVALSASTTWGMTVTCELFDDDAPIVTAAQQSTSGTGTTASATVSFAKEGYYAIHVFVDGFGTTVSASMTMVSSTSGAVFAHLPLPAFEANKQAIDGVRIIGASCMYTNNAALIQKAGTLVGSQIPKNTDWTDYIGPLSLVSKLAGSRTLDAQNGIYGFLKLTETEDLQLQEAFQIEPVSQLIAASYFPLRSVKSFLIVRGSISPTDGRSGFMTIANSVEYGTTDVWRPIDIPRSDPDVYKRALEGLRHIQQWHENPVHLKEIFKQVLSGATSLIKGVQKYAPQALTIAELLGGFLA